MLLFSNKLSTPKHQEEDDPLETQKNSLKTLSKQEKLLLVELQRTRQSIIEELGNLDPRIAAAGWTTVQKTIKTYENKIKADIRDYSKEGKQTSQDVGRAPRLHTGVDMLPVLASTGEYALEVGLRQRALKLPVIKLPTIDLSKYSTSSVEMDEDHKKGASKLVQTDIYSIFTKYNSLKSFLIALSTKSKSMTRKEIDVLWSHLAITFKDVESIEAELQRKYTSLPSTTTSQTSIFIAVAEGIEEAQRVLEKTESPVASPTVVVKSNIFTENQSDNTINKPMKRGMSMFDVRGEDGRRNHGSNTSNSKPLSKTIGPGVLRPNSVVGSRSSAASRASTAFHSDMSLMSVDLSRSSRTNTLKPLQRNGTSGSKRLTQTLNMSQSCDGFSTAKLHSRSSTSHGKNSHPDLKMELIRSLMSMQMHTSLVKEDMVAVQGIVDVRQPKAKAYMLTMAAERMQKALARVVLKQEKRGFDALRLVVQLMRRDERMDVYIRFQGMRHVSLGLESLLCKAMRKKFSLWYNFTKAEILRIRRALELQSAITIQRVVRGYFGRLKAASKRTEHKFKKLHDATISIQALIRGKVIRWRYLKLRHEQKRDRSARLIQRVYRGHRGRIRFKHYHKLRTQYLAAVLIQATIRRKLAWKRVTVLKAARIRHRAASKIQSLVRGFLVRCRMFSGIRERGEARAATKIQSVARMFIVKKYMAQRRKELLAARDRRVKAATKIQATYRGFRGYLKSKIILLDVRKAKERKAAYATKICNMVRCFLARAKRRKLTKARHTAWLAAARLWQEMWSEDAAAWFYLNAENGEALWEPPPGGYTRTDTKLVLQNGQIIDDPRFQRTNIFGEVEEDETEKKPQNLCGECDQRVAIRHCHECGDKYCTKCYKSTHALGTRRTHTFKPTGPLDCAECEELLAERWCVSCDEAFCDACWRKLHTRGKRRFHPYSEITPEGRIDKRIFTNDGEEVASYDATFAQQKQETALAAQDAEAAALADDIYGDSSYNDQLALGYDGAYGGDGSASLEEWSQYEDGEGTPYWFNNYTQESQYDDPYA